MRDLSVYLWAAAVGAAAMSLSLLAAPAWFAATLAAGAAALGAATAARRRRLARLQAEQEHARALRWRDERLAHTAHELRTPLAAVATAIELLREGYAETPEDQSDFLDQAGAAVRHMAFLLNDVVDLAAIENGRLTLQVQPQPLGDLLADAERVMRLPARERGVRLHWEGPAPETVVLADRGRFLQVVFNLVANALKFSPRGAEVRCRAEVRRRTVRFEVQDRGPGVEEGRRDRLFSRFARLHEDRLPSVAGAGLGLHVSRMLVESMGGSIGHRPARGGGSVFWFTLPLSAPTVRSGDGLVARG